MKNNNKGNEMNYDPSKPYCGFDNVNDLKADLVAAFQEAIVIPNEWLPAEYQNHKEFESGNLRDLDGQVCGPSLAQIEKKYKKLNAEAREQTEAQKEKAERTSRIENMAAQYDAEDSFEYDVDENRLHRNMVAFCSAAQLIDQDDIDEQNFFGGE
jgi:uncharacterized protein YjbJ (UPF0337 family)